MFSLWVGIFIVGAIIVLLCGSSIRYSYILFGMAMQALTTSILQDMQMITVAPGQQAFCAAGFMALAFIFAIVGMWRSV